MTIPLRGVTSRSTYFVTASTHEKKSILQSERTVGRFIEVLLHYRKEQKYLLREFVVMPDHFHLLITPASVTLERSMQFIKGGYSHRVRRELGFRGEIWQTSFTITGLEMQRNMKTSEHTSTTIQSKEACVIGQRNSHLDRLAAGLSLTRYLSG